MADLFSLSKASVRQHKVIEVAKSPLNRRMIEGESFVTGHVTLGESLDAAKEGSHSIRQDFDRR